MSTLDQSALQAHSLATVTTPLPPLDTFARRHLGPTDSEIAAMLGSLGFASMDALMDATIPASIRLRRPLQLDDPTNTHRFAARGERETLEALHRLASMNQPLRSYLGMGYHDTVTPPVVLRNVLENPAWYTAYTPYQAEISQGRLEALLNFQTMITELTAMEVAGASLLDEATAAAEAMHLCVAHAGPSARNFFVAEECHPQTIAVMETRASGLGVKLIVGDPTTADFKALECCGVLVQYPTTDGRVCDWREVVERAHSTGALAVVAADLLSLCLLTPPGEWGADMVVGSAQRFGVPMGLGGPHAAFFATRNALVRKMPGRLIGVSRDSHGRPALRMAIQTREQHIKRDRATSNICTAQVLLAVISGFYGAWHGPEGLRSIASRVHAATNVLAAGVRALGHDPGTGPWFDTLRVKPAAGTRGAAIIEAALTRGINLRSFADGSVGVSLDETVLASDLQDLLDAFAAPTGSPAPLLADLLRDDAASRSPITAALRRRGDFMQQEVFSRFHSEHEMLRYIHHLQSKDLSLVHSMITLGSCTMKLNATSEMIPVTWPGFGRIHPFAPTAQWRGYAELFRQLEAWLAEITGFAAVSLQPNAGSQGEYAGLMVMRAYHRERGDAHRTICLIPDSAHGTNPASAVVAGMRVIPVATDSKGMIDVADMRRKAEQHAKELAGCMITYPSTAGVFEETVREVCDIVHQHGGLVYMDGANMNAQVGLTRPGDIGADVCHLNLHKTFCIPHGGGGPGMGPIGVTEALAPFLPGHPVVRPDSAGRKSIGPISAAPYGSASILPISWMYIAMMGADGLKRASEVAILNANYMAKRLEGHYPILFTNHEGRCAHEFIIDCRGYEKSADVRIDDIAKRLMDYGFHAPTMSWPVPGTLMIEPTESESKDELDRFCDALISIRGEIRAIEEGRMDRADNPLKHAPHTAQAVTADAWPHAYSREQAAYPAPWTRDRKFWPAVGRVDNPYGDRNLVCTCEPMSAYH
ncbi:MAG: aminomethyl-transferring glycine dehydrogenase [Phycisphaeraceae bacterium]|nr:aminomethyl-transferring glycine dehydrogenase [Phycisphaeraceae bacterium]